MKTVKEPASAMDSSALNMNWVTDQLALGGRFPAEAAPLLANRFRIRCVVDCRGEDRDDEDVLLRHGIKLLHLPTPDLQGLTPRLLRAGVAWVRDHLALGERVLIHCEHGIGRSALLGCCVLVAEGHAPLEALSHAKRARHVVSPSPQQLETFMAWLRTWKRTHAAAWDVPVFDELARIAYSHLTVLADSRP